MRKLVFYCRGQKYTVDPKNGDFLSARDNYFRDKDTRKQHEWKFLGVSFHHWRNGIDIQIEEFNKRPLLIPHDLVGGLVWDRDHGTTRQWGGSYNGKLPRITSAYWEG